MIEKYTLFINRDLWRLDVDEMSKSKHFLIQQLRVFVLAFRGFNDAQIMMRASALTFYTLISIVPVVAMAFGIATGFGFEDILNAQIKNTFESQADIADMLIEFSHSLLKNTRGGLVAGIGLLILFWSVMKVLTNIELSFNAVWGITKSRNWVRKFTEYLSIMLVAPVFVILSGGITVFITSTSNNLISQHDTLRFLGPFVLFFVQLSPYILIWLLFTFLYIAIPNTKVQFKHALLGGILAGTAFQVLEWAYFTFQIGAVKYNAIYGSFAALPLFLIWLQSSWTIILFGCEVSFASQNVKQYVYENETANISFSYRKKITLLIIILIEKNFKKGNKPYTVGDLATELKLPLRLIQIIIDDLMKLGLVLESYTNKIKLVGYTPARDLDGILILDLLKMIEDNGNEDIPIKKIHEWDWINKTLTNKDYYQKINEMDMSKLISEIGTK
jgi:membrane protein